MLCLRYGGSMYKSVVITGITGQMGSILAEKCLGKEYKVYGLVRRTSQKSLGQAESFKDHPNLEIVEGDLLDPPSLLSLVKSARPDMFFHLAAQSDVGISFNQPVYTYQANALGTLNCLEAIRQSGIHSRFLHSATSEMFGGVSSKPANEDTPFHPRSPYGVSKVAAFWTTVNFRETYKIFACNTICFNNESPRRGPNFVTRKITLGIAAIKAGKQDFLYLGNLDAKRDWGSSYDYTDGMLMVLESSAPSDYVLATGETHSVREFCEIAFEHAGLGDYQQYVKVDPRFFRPCEVNVLLGSYDKINRELGWTPKTKFQDLVKKMVDADLGNT